MMNTKRSNKADNGTINNLIISDNLYFDGDKRKVSELINKFTGNVLTKKYYLVCFLNDENKPVIFESNMRTDWVLGNPFFCKYLFIFNSDSKEIGFYSQNINDYIIEENNEKKEENSFANIIKKIIIGLLLIIIGIIIGKKIFGLRRKLRANELEDKFEYKAADKQIQLF